MSKLIIFDCDGVLIDSEYLSSQVDARELARLGYYATPEECLRRFTGKGYAKMRELIKEESAIDIPESFFLSHQRVVLQELEKNIRPLLTSTLSFLKEQKVARGIASGSPRSRVISCLKRAGQLSFFKEEDVFTREQVNKGKPNPDLFLWAAKTLQKDPRSCLVVEDTVAGVQAAESAKMKVIAFLGGEHAQFEWYKAQMKALDVPLVDTDEQLLEYIKSYSFC